MPEAEINTLVQKSNSCACEKDWKTYPSLIAKKPVDWWGRHEKSSMKRVRCPAKSEVPETQINILRRRENFLK
ncbi:hypothetical protein B9K06_05495 [Bacillus sp. OG2]|nr:hypothetical protein B9K06_05495 [Bacillus sp. OG2]